MDIEYIKDAPNGSAGMVDKETKKEGNIEIVTGFAKAVPPAKPKRKSKSKDKTDDGTLTNEGTKTDTKTDDE